MGFQEVTRVVIAISVFAVGVGESRKSRAGRRERVGRDSSDADLSQTSDSLMSLALFLPLRVAQGVYEEALEVVGVSARTGHGREF